MTHSLQTTTNVSRRAFSLSALGSMTAMCWMASRDGSLIQAAPNERMAKAKRVVFLHQSGAPSQMDLLDPKPVLNQRHGEELPESIHRGRRLTTMTSEQEEKPLVGSPYKFKRFGETGLEISELLPHTASIADRLCVVRSMTTDAINHDPAMSFFYTGSQQPGRPSFGSWVSFGLSRPRAAMPDFVVMVSGGQPGDQPLTSRLWSAGFLPEQHTGVRMRSGKDPLLFLANPPGIDKAVRKIQLDALRSLDGPADTRWRQYQQAFQLQDLMPQLADTSNEPESTWKLYGDEAKQPGTFAANCLRARRLLEADVPVVQLFHRGWDHHSQILRQLPIKCRETDQGAAALVKDLDQRGLLKDTLVVWAGEFGRTAFCQGKLSGSDYGRDHHAGCFSIWLAGGGVRPGAHGVTDDFSYNVAKDEVHVHDLQATILQLLGFDHKQLTFHTNGRDYRLTDQFGHVVKQLTS